MALGGVLCCTLVLLGGALAGLPALTAPFVLSTWAITWVAVSMKRLSWR